MAKIRKYRLSWNASESTDVSNYKFYYDTNPLSYDSPNVNVGNVTEIFIPNDVPDFPLVDGIYNLGVSAVDDAGNESDMAVINEFPFDLVAPNAPSNFVVEPI
jgi:hypothetical protein